MGRLSKSLTALGVVALLLVGGGAYALASSNGTITVCVKHAGGGLYQAKKCAKHDRQLRWNTQGPAGGTGSQGQQGPQGIQGVQGPPAADGAPAAVQVAGWSGAIGTIPTSVGFAFAGPTATVTTTAADATIVASGSASLGVSTGSATGAIAICYQAASGGLLKVLDDNSGSASEGFSASNAKTTQSSSQTGAPGAGTWKVGICVETSTGTLDHNDWSVGCAMVTAGSPTSQ
jgi:hypothetical protein